MESTLLKTAEDRADFVKELSKEFFTKEATVERLRTTKDLHAVVSALGTLS